MPNTQRMRVVRRAPEELSDAQIERLIGFGRAEADVIDELEAAARAGDRELAWQLARKLVELQDAAAAVKSA
jgi:hypothetical protein